MASEADPLYTTAQVREFFGNRSHMWIKRRMATAGLPRPIYLTGSRLRFWPLSKLVAWRDANDVTKSRVPQDISFVRRARNNRKPLLKRGKI